MLEAGVIIEEEHNVGSKESESAEQVVIDLTDIDKSVLKHISEIADLMLKYPAEKYPKEIPSLEKGVEKKRKMKKKQKDLLRETFLKFLDQFEEEDEEDEKEGDEE
jgi:hypothetical protein